MTMFAVTQTTRFKAAVAGAGISDWQSYYGENSIDQWMVPFFGKTVYDDPAIYAKSSAIDFIKNVKTPTLVVVGDRDAELPALQTFEFWHALPPRTAPDGPPARDWSSSSRTILGADTFRATRIPAHLKNGGKLEVAQQMAAHESARTTGLYDRRGDEISLGAHSDDADQSFRSHA